MTKKEKKKDRGNKRKEGMLQAKEKRESFKPPF